MNDALFAAVIKEFQGWLLREIKELNRACENLGCQGLSGHSELSHYRAQILKDVYTKLEFQIIKESEKRALVPR